jgi:hypothetical protein
LKDSHNIKDSPTQYEEELKSMKERLTKCLQLLKINYNEISKTAFKLIEIAVHEQTAKKTYLGQWIIALNVISGSCLLNQRIFSQSEIYDFLTVAVTTSIERRTKVIDEIIFRIYRDIMANYESSDKRLKITYPKIIVDVIAILAKGEETSGKKIPLHNVENYYQMRKADVIGTFPPSVIAEVSIPTTPATTATTTAASTSATAASIKNIKRDGKREEPVSIEYKEQQQSPNKEDEEEEEAELVESLNKITDRSKKDIQALIAKLERRDIERIKDLCKNYNKLQKYSKLITDADNLKEFKAALQNETRKKLSSHQIQHAANSIRKAKPYIENVLDGKFIPRGSYGINHTRHNLEYGYLIVGLMQPSKRRTMTTTTTKEKK